MLKILTNKCDRETINYNPSRDLWINRLYFSISNEKSNCCLTIDCTNARPAKYRINADNALSNLVTTHRERKIGSIISFWLKG